MTGGQSFWLDDRRVIVRTGTKSQTVNVCTPENAPGEYEAVYRLPILSAIAAPDVPEMADLQAFVCVKDTVSRDGLGLPGSHGCGARRVLRTVSYLG